MPNALTFAWKTDVAPAQRAVASLAQSITQSMASVSAGAIGAARGYDMFASAALRTVAIAGGVAAAWFVVSSAVEGVRKQLEDMVEVGEKADKAGVGAGFFQAFTQGLADTKQGAEDLEKALNKAREAARGGLVGTVEQLNASYFKGGDESTGVGAFRNASSQEERIRAILVLMQDLKRAGAELAALELGEKVFGRDFADKIREGKTSIDGLLRTLDEKLGTGGAGLEFFSEHNVRHARELNDRLTDAWQTIDRNLKPSWDSLTTTTLGLKSLWVQIVELIARASNVTSPEAALERARARRAEVERELATGTPTDNGFGGALPGGTRGFRRRTQLEQERDQLNRDLARSDTATYGSEFSQHPGYPVDVPGGQLPRPRPQIPKDESGGGAFSLDQIERFISTMERARDITQAELDNLGKSNVERAKAIALAAAEAAARSAGRELTDAEKARIEQLAEAHSRLNDKLKDQKQKLQENAEMVRHFGQAGVDALGDMIFEAKSFNDVLDGLMKMLGRAILQAMVLGTGPLAGLLGMSAPASAGPNAVGGLLGILKGLFGGMAGGTDHWRGGLTWTGENGPELVNVPRGAQIIPNHVLARGGGGQQEIIVHVVSDDEKFGAYVDGRAARVVRTSASAIKSDTMGATRRNMPGWQSQAQMLQG